MSPALSNYLLTQRLRPARRNRRRPTGAARRIIAAAAIAAAATLAAVGWTAGAAASAQTRDAAVARVAHYLMHGGPLTVADMDAAPADMQAAAWQTWGRAVIRAHRARVDAEQAAASRRVLDFAAGRADSVSEADLMDASPAAVRAAVNSGRLD